MKYIIRSAKMENTDAIKEYIENKLARLDKYFQDSDEIEANVLTKVNGKKQTIEVTIPTKHFTRDFTLSFGSDAARAAFL